MNKIAKPKFPKTVGKEFSFAVIQFLNRFIKSCYLFFITSYLVIDISPIWHNITV